MNEFVTVMSHFTFDQPFAGHSLRDTNLTNVLLEYDMNMIFFTSLYYNFLSIIWNQM